MKLLIQRDYVLTPCRQEYAPLLRECFMKYSVYYREVATDSVDVIFTILTQKVTLEADDMGTFLDCIDEWMQGTLTLTHLGTMTFEFSLDTSRWAQNT